MNLKEYNKLEQHDQNIIFYDASENEIVKLEDLIQLLNEEKSRENFTESMLSNFMPMRVICADCKKKALLYADPCEKHKNCGDVAYRCEHCDTLNNDWIVHSLTYGKTVIKILQKPKQERTSQEWERAKSLVESLDSYWINSVIIK